jgi:hypothetical protein
VANDGKLAVVLGIEVSRLFGCGINNGIPQCDKARVNRELDEVYDLGVRQMEIINKFDNAFGGVAGDAGQTGTVVNTQNRQETGRYWDMRTCDSEGPGEHDREQTTTGTPAQDAIFGVTFGTTPLLEPGTAPLYPGARTATPRPERPRRARRAPDDEQGHVHRPRPPRRLRAPPAAGHRRVPPLLGHRVVAHLVDAGRREAHPARGRHRHPVRRRLDDLRQEVPRAAGRRDPRWRDGAGYGATPTASAGRARRGPAPSRTRSRTPFKSFDGSVTFERQQSGERTFDINKEGVAHYGLYADWFEDLRKIAGDSILEDMSLGADSYLRSWERAVGIAPETCRDGRLRITGRGMGLTEIGIPAQQLLRAAGQPTSRIGRSWRWCVEDRGNEKQLVRTAFTPDGIVGLIGSAVRRHRIDGVGAGAKASRIRGARRFGSGVRIRSAGGGRRFVYGTRGGRVRWVAVATAQASRDPGTLRSYLRIAGLV